MTRRKSDPYLRQFETVAMHLVANKVFMEYMSVIETFGPTEPEHFVEEWMCRNHLQLTPNLANLVWFYFLDFLIEQREHRGTG